MHCDDAARALHTGLSSRELDIHLSACEECRALAEDLAQLNRAFANAREAWAPPPGFRVHLPVAPWRRLAIAASLLVLPLAAWAFTSVATQKPTYDVGVILEPRNETASTDRETLGALLLGRQP